MGNVTSFAGNGLTSKLNRPWFCPQWTAACAGIYNSHSEVFGAARDSAALRLRRKVNNWKGLGPSPGQDFSQRYAPYACRTDNFLNPSAKNASALFAKAMALPRAIKTAFTLESRRQICNMQAQGPCRRRRQFELQMSSRTPIPRDRPFTFSPQHFNFSFHTVPTELIRLAFCLSARRTGLLCRQGTSARAVAGRPLADENRRAMVLHGNKRRNLCNL